MNEDEKDIERCNELIKEEHSNWIGIINQKAIETVLNLIDKQQKEIENFKWKENEQKNLLKYKTDRIEEQQKEIDKQNKVIDKMAQELIDMQIRQLTGIDLFRFTNKEDTKQYFIRKVKEDVQ